MDKARPTFEDEQPVNVFDLWEGADFKLRMRKVEGYPNYDQSVFLEPSPIAGGDEEEILKVVNKQYQLSELLDRKNFKTYEELARKLATVLDSGSGPLQSAASIAENDDYVPPSRPNQFEASVDTPKVSISQASEDDDDEDAMSFFKKIAQED